MDGEWFALGVVHQRTSSAIDLDIFSMHPALIILIHSHDSRITGIITDHRKSLIVIICHHNPSQFSFFCRLIAVQLQDLRIKIVFRILIKLDRNKTIFIVSIRTDRRKSKQFFCQIIGLLRQCLSHGKDHLH